MALAIIDPSDRSRPELLALRPAQRAIYWDLLLWCVESENDGVCHTDAIRMACHAGDGRTVTAALDAMQRTGLIEAHPDKGPGWFIVAGFLKLNKSREQRALERAANTERQARHRAKHAKTPRRPPSPPPTVTRDTGSASRVSNAVSNGHLSYLLPPPTGEEEDVTPVDAVGGDPALTDRGSAGPPRDSEDPPAGVPAAAINCLPTDSAVRAAMARVIDESPARLTVLAGGAAP